MDEDGERRSLVTYAVGAQSKMIINKMMLRFRPIAPKPVAGNSFTSQAPAGDKNPLATKKRLKRKYVRVQKNNIGYNRKRRVSNSSDPEKNTDDNSSSHKNLVTLQLLPEKDGLGSGETVRHRGKNDTGDHTDHEDNNWDPQVGLTSLIKGDQLIAREPSSDQTVVESWVTVERVTCGCTDEGRRNQLLGCTDFLRVKSLEADTCPGFISDRSNRVQMINGAYRKMMGVSADDDRSPPSEIIRVWLVVRDVEVLTCMGVLYGTATCRVRLQYTSTRRKEKKQSKEMMVPCDVWRMEFGGFAWRLDVEAALSLGR